MAASRNFKVSRKGVQIQAVICPELYHISDSDIMLLSEALGCKPYLEFGLTLITLAPTFAGIIFSIPKISLIATIISATIISLCFIFGVILCLMWQRGKQKANLIKNRIKRQTINFGSFPQTGSN